MRNRPKWTPEMVRDLEEMYAKPSSSREYMTILEITSALRHKYGATYKGNLTRNGIISKLASTGLAVRYPRRGAMPPKPRVKKKKQGTAAYTSYKSSVSAPTEPPPMPVIVEPPGKFSCAWADANDAQCVWPLEERNGVTFVCGNPKKRGSLARPSSYCEHHARIASGGYSVPRPPSDTKLQSRSASFKSWRYA